MYFSAPEISTQTRLPMPTYDYICSACGHAWEEFQQMSAQPLKLCPKCKAKKAQRQIGAGAGLIFKGSGFYITDYKKSGKGGDSSGGGKGTSSVDNKSSGGGESKSSSGGDKSESQPAGAASAPSEPAKTTPAAESAAGSTKSNDKAKSSSAKPKAKAK